MCLKSRKKGKRGRIGKETDTTTSWVHCGTKARNPFPRSNERIFRWATWKESHHANVYLHLPDWTEILGTITGQENSPFREQPLSRDQHPYVNSIQNVSLDIPKMENSN